MLFRKHRLSEHSDTVGNLAVIIPAFNEEKNIALAIKSALEQEDDDDATSWTSSKSTSKSKSTTVVVVDGGSSDGTVSAARRAGASLVLRCRTRGRGAQLAAGIAAVGLGGPSSCHSSSSDYNCSSSSLSLSSSSSSFFLPPPPWRRKKPDTVLFLHADSRLPRRYRRSIDEALSGFALGDNKKKNENQAPSFWGSFETVLPDGGRTRETQTPPPPTNELAPLPPPVGRFLSTCVALRTRLFGLPYGDQAIFVRSSLLEEVGGVRPLPLMEDVDLVDRLSRAGREGRRKLISSSSFSSYMKNSCVVNSRPAIARGAVSTSGRRWAEKGLVRATVLNLWTLARWRLGLARADELAREYYQGSS